MNRDLVATQGPYVLPDEAPRRATARAGEDRATTSAGELQAVPFGGLRILAIAACPMPARRGTPVRIERLSEALVARGHEVTIATYHIGEACEASSLELMRIDRPFAAGTLPPGPSLAKFLRWDPQLLTTTRRLLAQRSFDLIHAHHFEGLLLGALARSRGMPLVYDAHTALGSELPTYVSAAFRPVVRRFARWLDGLLPRLADHCICAGSGVRDTLVDRHGFAENRVTVAWNGVELAQFDAAAAGRAALMHTGAVPRRVLYSGTLAEYQDIDLLLEAFALLRQTHTDTRLVLATQSPLGSLAGRVQSLGIAAFVEVVGGNFDELPDQLASAAVAVLPRTTCEGVPQKLLNYMAAGCPVVASRGSATLLEHGVTGLVVDNYDVEGFAQEMRRIIDKPELAQALGRRARAVAVEHFSWDATAATVERVYRKLLPAHVAMPADDVRTA